MKTAKFQVSDEVAVSVAFLRSIGTEKFAVGNAGPSRYDPGIGTIMLLIDSINCAQVWFPDRQKLITYNIGNLVHRRSIHFEANR